MVRIEMLQICPRTNQSEHNTSVVPAPTTPILVHCPQPFDVLTRNPSIPPVTFNGGHQLTANVLKGIRKETDILSGDSGNAAIIIDSALVVSV